MGVGFWLIFIFFFEPLCMFRMCLTINFLSCFNLSKNLLLNVVVLLLMPFPFLIWTLVDALLTFCKLSNSEVFILFSKIKLLLGTTEVKKKGS